MSFLNKVGKVIMFTSTKSVSHYWLIEIWMKNVLPSPGMIHTTVILSIVSSLTISWVLFPLVKIFILTGPRAGSFSSLYALIIVVFPSAVQLSSGLRRPFPLPCTGYLEFSLKICLLSSVVGDLPAHGSHEQNTKLNRRMMASKVANWMTITGAKYSVVPIVADTSAYSMFGEKRVAFVRIIESFKEKFISWGSSWRYGDPVLLLVWRFCSLNYKHHL